MTGPAKRRTVEEEDSDSSDHNSEEENYSEQMEIIADFEGRNPAAEDFHLIKKLLERLFLQSAIDLSQLTDMLINQQGIGSVLKQSMDEVDDEDEDEYDDLDMDNNVFGVTSMINITAHKETPCIQQFISLVIELSEKHADTDTKDNIKRICSEKKVGLLINERYMNIPAKVADPLLTSLVGEVDRMKKRDQSYNFDYIIIISKILKPKTNEGEVIFVNNEETVFSSKSTLKFDVNVEKMCNLSVDGKFTEEDVPLVPYRQIMFIDGSQFNNIVYDIKSFVN